MQLSEYTCESTFRSSVVEMITIEIFHSAQLPAFGEFTWAPGWKQLNQHTKHTQAEHISVYNIYKYTRIYIYICNVDKSEMM